MIKVMKMFSTYMIEQKDVVCNKTLWSSSGSKKVNAHKPPQNDKSNSTNLLLKSSKIFLKN